jgi:PIN domain nuclease of toxin-antitoxin system
MLPTRTEDNNFVQVAYEESADAALETEQKEQVTKAIHDTRKVLEMNWREVEKSIGDGMTSTEKIKAKQEYMAEIEKINWKNVEKGLKIQYKEINWEVVNENLANSMAIATIDSVQETCTKVATQLHRLNATQAQTQAMLIPDVSVQQIEKAKTDIQKQLDELKKLKATRKAVRL